MTDNINRDFKGVWLPKEIYLNQDLSWTEKILLIEINSLENEEGCFASNEYLASFLMCSVKNIEAMLTKLRKLNLIFTKKFDGRNRFLGTQISEQTPRKVGGRPLENEGADPLKSRRQTPRKVGGSIIYINNTSINNTSINKEKSIKEKQVFLTPQEAKDILKPNFIDQEAWEEYVDHRFSGKNKKGVKFAKLTEKACNCIFNAIDRITKENIHLTSKIVLNYAVNESYEGIKSHWQLWNELNREKQKLSENQFGEKVIRRISSEEAREMAFAMYKEQIKNTDSSVGSDSEYDF